MEPNYSDKQIEGFIHSDWDVDACITKLCEDVQTARREARETQIEVRELITLLKDGPPAASCRVHLGHDYNHNSVCVRGCGIPEDGFVHDLQRNIFFQDARIAKLVEALKAARQEFDDCEHDTLGTPTEEHFRNLKHEMDAALASSDDKEKV